MFDKQKKIDQIGFGLAYLETSIKTFSTAKEGANKFLI